MTSFIEKLTGSMAALVNQARAENEADRCLAQTKRDLIQLAERYPDNWDIIRALADPPFLTLQMNVPMEHIEDIQEALCDIYFDYKRRHGDKPTITIEGNIDLTRSRARF